MEADQHNSRIFHLVVETRDPEHERYAVSVTTKGFRTDPEEIAFRPDGDFEDKVLRIHERDEKRRIQDFDLLERTCSAVGESLFRYLLTDAARQQLQAYRESVPTTRIALHLPRRLYRFPWELLRDPADPQGRFLSVQGSVIRYDGESQSPGDTLFQPQKPPIEFLFVLASPEEQPIGQFEPLEKTWVKFSSVQPPTYDNFERSLLRNPERYYGMVFFGHGEVEDQHGSLIFVREQRRRTFRSFVRDPKHGHVICDCLGDRNAMRLACIFACESAWADHGLPFEQSVVGSLISRTWLAFVIGAQTGIDRFAAQEFLDAALDALEQGVSLDLALACGRRAIRGIDHRESSRKHSRLDWWIPVLYSTTDNFEILPEESRDILPHTWTKEGTLPKEMSPLPRSPSGLRALWQAFLRTLTGPISPERESVREMLARKEKL